MNGTSCHRLTLRLPLTQWLMLCWIGWKTQHCNMGLFPASQKSTVIFSLLKASAEKAFVPNAGGIQAATGRRRWEGGGGEGECMGALVDRAAGTEPPCLAGTGKIPCYTNHTSFFPPPPLLLLFSHSSSSSSSSLQVTVMRGRLSWGELTAHINKWAFCTKKHTQTVIKFKYIFSA